VSANVPALLIVLMPVNSRLEPICTRNTQSAPN